MNLSSLPNINDFSLQQVKVFTNEQLINFIQQIIMKKKNDKFFSTPVNLQKTNFYQCKGYGKLQVVCKFSLVYKTPVKTRIFEMATQLHCLCLCECGNWTVKPWKDVWSNSQRSCGKCPVLGFNIKDFENKKVGKFDITDTRFEKIYKNIYELFKEEKLEDTTKQYDFFTKMISRELINNVHYLFLDENNNIDDKNTKRYKLFVNSKRPLYLAQLDPRGNLIKIYDSMERTLNSPASHHINSILEAASYSPYFDYPKDPCYNGYIWGYADKDKNLLNYHYIFPFLCYDNISKDTPVVKHDLNKEIIEYYNNLEECALKEPFSKNVISICCTVGDLYLNNISYSFYDNDKKIIIPPNFWRYNKHFNANYYHNNFYFIVKLDKEGLPYKVLNQKEKDLHSSRPPKGRRNRTVFIRKGQPIQIFTTEDYKYNTIFAPAEYKKPEPRKGYKVAQLDRDTKEVINVYPSIREAARQVGIDRYRITRWVKEGTPPSQPVIWKRVDNK